MGAPKAGLEWHGSTLVRRVAGILERAVDGPVVVVRAPGQALPRLPDGIEVVEDACAGRGPLEGLAAGLAAVAGRAPAAFVSATDAPLLHPAFVRAVVGGLGAEDEICVPSIGGFDHALAGAYRVGVAATVGELLGSGQLRVGLVLERSRTRRLGPAELLGAAGVADGDPELESVVNLNGPQEYARARRRPPPAIQVFFRSGLAGAGRGEGRARVARAATLGALARAVDLDLGGGIVASVDGRAGVDDPELPLVRGDVVCFERASG
jgi:molybdopterin-guanine dinucleotide biosynthesis protein A